MIVIAGEPVAKGRPRFGGGRVYTPQKTKAYEEKIAQAARDAGAVVLDGPICLTLRCYFPFSGAARRRGDVYHIKRPDIDNIIKIVGDALNGIAWKDDSQIVSVLAEKGLSEYPRLEIEWHKENGLE